MAAANHPPRPRSATPCADQPQPPPAHGITWSPNPAPTSPCSICSLKVRRAHQLSATQASLQPLPARAAVTGLASQYVVSQQATGIEPATPDPRLEEHGCRPRPPGHSQQVGIESVTACQTVRTLSPNLRSPNLCGRVDLCHIADR